MVTKTICLPTFKISFLCVLQKKHNTGLKRHEGKSMMTMKMFFYHKIKINFSLSVSDRESMS